MLRRARPLPKTDAHQLLALLHCHSTREGVGIPEGIKVKILLINEILNKECMAEGEVRRRTRRGGCLDWAITKVAT